MLLFYILKKTVKNLCDTDRLFKEQYDTIKNIILKDLNMAEDVSFIVGSIYKNLIKIREKLHDIAYSPHSELFADENLCTAISKLKESSYSIGAAFNQINHDKNHIISEK